MRLQDLEKARRLSDELERAIKLKRYYEEGNRYNMRRFVLNVQGYHRHPHEDLADDEHRWDKGPCMSVTPDASGLLDAYITHLTGELKSIGVDP